MLEIKMRVCYTLWNHDYCIIKCFLGHKFLRSTKTHTHGSSLQCVNTQFNSMLQVSQDPLLHVNVFTQMHRAWNLLEWILCMRNYDCIQPHNDVLESTMRGQEQECSEQHSALAVKTIMKQGQQWQWKQQCPQQQKQNSAFTMKAKLWNRGENNSVHNDAALSLWRQNSITMVTRALKMAVFTTTWQSHFEDKIMKHWWLTALKKTVFTANTALSLLKTKLWNTGDNKKCCSLQLWNYETLVTTNSVSTLLPEEMKSWTTCASNNAHFHFMTTMMKHQWSQWLWACNYEIMVTTINLKLQLWENLWQVWTAITHFEDEIWWNIDSYD
jgi:hypothetical protein